MTTPREPSSNYRSKEWSAHTSLSLKVWLTRLLVSLLPLFLLSCFILGLSPEILCKVQALQPLSLVQVAALARLQEDKLNDIKSTACPQFTPPIYTLLPLTLFPHRRYPPFFWHPQKPPSRDSLLLKWWFVVTKAYITITMNDTVLTTNARQNSFSLSQMTMFPHRRYPPL